MSESKQHWETFLNQITNYIEQRQQGPVVDYKNAKELSSILNLDLSDTPVEVDDFFKTIQQYLKYSVKTIHPRFSNQLYGGFSLPALMGEIVTALTNTSIATFEIAPVATLMEKQMIAKMAQEVGYNQGHDGIMLTGGSNANMMSIIAARNTKFPDIYEKGMQGRRLALFVSDQAHYSFKKSVHIMGLGQENLILVPSNDQGEMIPAELQKCIESAKSDGLTPFYVGATAGTTVMGAIDPLKEISTICQEHGLWFHIDGAWGGSILLSEEYKHLLTGSHLADSFTWDAHKMMNIPIICSFFLTKHDGIMRKLNGSGGSKYIFHDYENREYDTGPNSLQCGRKVDVLKIWLHWQYYGKKAIGQKITHQFKLSQYLAAKVKESEHFELIIEPKTVNVCFALKATTLDEQNELNFQTRFRLVQDGRFMTNFSCTKEGKIFFRHVFTHEIGRAHV